MKLKRAVFGLVLLLILVRVSPLLYPLRVGAHARNRLVRFYDNDGHVIGSVLTGGDLAAQYARLSDVSSNVVLAFLAAEDKRFYTHGGVDYLALGRAIVRNAQARRIVSGGSTITMQLARLLHPKRRTVWSKLQEIYAAWRLEAGMTKNQILEAYLNRVPMGGNLVGVGAGAEVYFGIPVSKVNVAQAAFLAAIPKSPSRRDPRLNPAVVEKRRAYVLRRMQDIRVDLPPHLRGSAVPRHVISDLNIETRLSSNATVSVNPREKSLNAHHFFFHVLKTVPTDADKVDVTLDEGIQKMVAEQVSQVLAGLKDRHVTNAAAVVLENRTGNVLAYVGSASYFDTEHQGKVDGVQARRQPGSALKPFLYALALERGYPPATVIADVPITFPGEEQPYEPENYSGTFHGPVRLRIALANSLNVPAIQVASAMGVPQVLEGLHHFGFASLQETPEHYGLGLVLGGGEVTLYEMARAYMALANGGVLRNPRMASNVDDLPIHHRDSNREIIDRETAWLITDITADKQARSLEFGRRSVLNLPFPCAVKTGTSSRFRDNWTVGFTSEHTVAAWVGNFDGSPMSGVSGVAGAGPLFARIMMNLYRRGSFPGPFERPADIVVRPVCSLSGRRPSALCPNVVDEYFVRRDIGDYDESSCTWHRRVSVDIRTGQPATASCPHEFRREQVDAVIPESFRVTKR